MKNQELAEYIDIAERYNACLKAKAMLKAEIPLQRIFAWRPDFAAWALANIPIDEWPQSALDSIESAQPIRLCLHIFGGWPYATLDIADLSYADLSGADLSYADLSGADLSYATVDGAILSGDSPLVTR